MPPLSAEARDLNWLIGNFATRTPGVAHAMVVTADGLPIAVSERLDRAMADQLAAIASGVASLSQDATRYFDARDREADRGGDAAGVPAGHGD
jgi:predicted regulator of Ras-like GTPase activity (Roadblock/LC7/MglB family)